MIIIWQFCLAICLLTFVRSSQYSYMKQTYSLNMNKKHTGATLSFYDLLCPYERTITEAVSLSLSRWCFFPERTMRTPVIYKTTCTDDQDFPALVAQNSALPFRLWYCISLMKINTKKKLFKKKKTKHFSQTELNKKLIWKLTVLKNK